MDSGSLEYLKINAFINFFFSFTSKHKLFSKKIKFHLFFL